MRGALSGSSGAISNAPLPSELQRQAWSFARAPRFDHDPVRDHEGRIEADAELADEFGRAAFRRLDFFEERRGCRNWRWCPERDGQILARHADAIVLDASAFAPPGSRVDADREGFAVARAARDRCWPRSAAFRRRRRRWRSARGERYRVRNRSNEPSDAAGAPHPPEKHGVRFRSWPIHASFFVLVLRMHRTGRWPRAAILRASAFLSRAGEGKIEPAGKSRPAHVACENVWIRSAAPAGGLRQRGDYRTPAMDKRQIELVKKRVKGASAAEL